MLVPKGLPAAAPFGPRVRNDFVTQGKRREHDNRAFSPGLLNNGHFVCVLFFMTFKFLSFLVTELNNPN